MSIETSQGGAPAAEITRLSRDAILDLARTAEEKLGGLSAEATRRAASLAVQLLGQGLNTAPEELPAVSGDRGALEEITNDASSIHQHRTGMPLSYERGNGSEYDVALGKLGAAWDELEAPPTHGEDSSHVSFFAGKITQEALAGLGEMSHDSKPIAVSPQTYDELRNVLNPPVSYS